MDNQETGAIITHNAASAGVIGADRNATQFKGVLLFIHISAISGTSPTLTVTIEGKAQASGQYYTVLQSAALSAVGLTVLRIYPGLTAAANLVANDILPASYRITTAIGGTTPSVSATISALVVD